MIFLFFTVAFASAKNLLSENPKTGPNAGKEFWGCTGYPACKSTRPIA